MAIGKATMSKRPYAGDERVPAAGNAVQKGSAMQQLLEDVEACVRRVSDSVSMTEDKFAPVLYGGEDKPALPAPVALEGPELYLRLRHAFIAIHAAMDRLDDIRARAAM